MKLITHILLLSLAITVGVHGRASQLADNGIYASSDDYRHGKLTSGFSGSDGTKFSAITGMTITIQKGREKTVFYCDEIWGYRSRGTDWRISNEESYRIDYIGKVCIYMLMGEPGLGIPDYVYFSAKPDSPIHRLTRKNLVAVFHSDKVFVERIKKMPWFHAIDKWNGKEGTYDFMGWIK